jgi:hypothetical protein
MKSILCVCVAIDPADGERLRRRIAGRQRRRLRGSLTTIGHWPNHVVLPEELDLLQLLTSLVEFPAGIGELRLQPRD